MDLHAVKNKVLSLLFVIIFPLSVSHAETRKLPVGTSVDGIQRKDTIELGGAESFVYPDMAMDKQGNIWVVMVNHDGKDEWLETMSLDRNGNISHRSIAWKGARAWHPRLAAARDKGVWLTWCGRKQLPAPEDHSRSIFISRLGTEGLTQTKRLDQGSGRDCDPDLAVDAEGSVHVVWESSQKDNAKVRIAYRALDPSGAPGTAVKIISPGPFDRRPSISTYRDKKGPGLAVAWDSLQDKKPTGAMDPDYDIWLTTKKGKKWSSPMAVDSGPGIQAAAYVVPAPGGGILLAYHSSLPHGLVKHWTIRRVVEHRVFKPLFPNPDAKVEKKGQQQGSEFPALAILPDHRLVIISRPSQGAYLQVMDAKGTSDVFDLTRAGWGSRGIHARALSMGDGKVWVVRRARKKVIMERLVLLKKGHGPKFVPSKKAPKKALPEFKTFVLPAELLSKPKGLKACVGDVHMHSAASDATGPPDEILARAWDRGLDYGVMTDHDNIVGHPQPVSEQDELAWLSDVFNAKEGFSTLQAYEWTTPPIPKGFGHRNVYFRDYPPDCWCKYKGRCHSSAALFHKLRQAKAIAIPHHTKWTGTDWDAMDEGIQRQFEMVSVHGANETTALQAIPSRGTMKGMAAQDGLAKGLHFGFVAGSDAHGLLWHHGVARKKNPWLSALTIAYATSCTRHGIFDAIYDRRTIATSGVRILVETMVAKAPMGSSVDATAPVLVQSRVLVPKPGFLVEVIRDGKVIHSQKEQEKHAVLDWMDKDVSPGKHYYYVRVTSHVFALVEMAWSSPVFVRVLPSKGEKGEGENEK